MRTYESMLVLNPDVSKEQVDGFVEKVKKFLGDHGGEVLKVEEWGLNPLAYGMKTKTQGYYLLLYFKGDTALVAELERSLRLMEEVFRYLTVKREGAILKAHKEEEGPKGEMVEDQGQPAAGET